MNRSVIIIVGATGMLIVSCKDFPDAAFTISRNTVEVGDTVYFENNCVGAEE
jgi:hypothetical protein